MFMFHTWNTGCIAQTDSTIYKVSVGEHEMYYQKSYIPVGHRPTIKFMLNDNIQAFIPSDDESWSDEDIQKARNDLWTFPVTETLSVPIIKDIKCILTEEELSQIKKDKDGMYVFIYCKSDGVITNVALEMGYGVCGIISKAKVYKILRHIQKEYKIKYYESMTRFSTWRYKGPVYCYFFVRLWD